MTRKPQSIIHCLSGGLDSVTLLYDLHGQGNKVCCVLFDYKQRHVQELLWAKHHCHRLGVMFRVVELQALGGLTAKSWVVPNRNAIFLSIAVNIAVEQGAEMVSYGCNKDDAGMFPDCRWSFVNAMNEMLKAGEVPVEIIAPYIGLSKWQIGGRAREMGVPVEETWSCYNGGRNPCGRCPTCKQRMKAKA